MPVEQYFSVEQFSNAIGASRQAAWKACKAGHWRGHVLDVRTIHGKGGKSGIQYEVKVSSLPEHLQLRLKTLHTSVEDVSNMRLGDTAQLERSWKYDVIRAALSHSKGSHERAVEVCRLIDTKRLDWKGKYRLLTKNSLYRWIQQFEDSGGSIHALARKVRSDVGVKKVYISRPWTNIVPFDDATKALISDDMQQFIRGLIKGGATRKIIRVLAGEKLEQITAAYGYLPNDARNAKNIFSIPHDLVQAEMHYKAVYRHKHDRKASEDDKPRIRRTIDGLAPMEVVVMDVHHINVRLSRENGTTATPKLLAFHDIATNRVFCEIIFFENRGGVRNSDVITAFRNMCLNPAFGVPKYLYCDNGSEYRFADDLDDALKLGTKFVAYSGLEERSQIIRAKPYNAPAKHVEGWFRQMNQQYFRHIPGWIDDDRMNPKRPEMGKLPAPFDQGFDSFCATVYGYLASYEHMPQQGALKGKSPAMVFSEQVRAGWKAIILTPEQLLTVFTRPEIRVVRKHGIEVRGVAWTCDELLEYFGRTVTIHVPKYHGFAELLITDERGNEIGVAVCDREFNVLDPRGAKESARRVSIRNKALTKLGKSVPDIDVGAELLAYGQRQIPITPNEPDGVISVNRPGTQKRALLPVAATKQSRQQQDEELRRQNAEARAAMAEIHAAGRKAS